ncbi:MAG: hypothetical protein U0414_00790 [Polyangiaceae bacterium]
MRPSAVAVTAALASALAGCGGGAPLLHPAHVLNPGDVSFGAGVIGQFGALDPPPPARPDDRGAPLLDSITVAPGVSPFVAGRVGITGGFEAGLTYTGREIRIDGRKAFTFKPWSLSLGLGGTVLLPKPLPGDSGSVYGAGADLPFLVGWKSDADLYSFWFGPRVGFEILGGRVLENQFVAGGSDNRFDDLSGQHVYAGGLLGFRVGFRHFHAALELDVNYHFAAGTFGPEEASSENLSIAPAGAMIASF